MNSQLNYAPQIWMFANKSLIDKILKIQLTLENSNTQFLELFDSSNKFFDPLNITHFFRQKNSNLDISNISVGRTKLLDPWKISSCSLELSFSHLGQNSKVLKFERFFGKKIPHKSF